MGGRITSRPRHRDLSKLLKTRLRKAEYLAEYLPGIRYPGQGDDSGFQHGAPYGEFPTARWNNFAVDLYFRQA